MEDLLTITGSLASILGFGLTIYVAKTIRAVRKSYVRQAMLPQLVKKLRQIARNLEESINSRDELLVRKALAQARTVAASIDSHVADRLTPRRLHETVLNAEHSAGGLLFRNASNVGNELQAEVERLTLLKYQFEWQSQDG